MDDEVVEAPVPDPVPDPIPDAPVAEPVPEPVPDTPVPDPVPDAPAKPAVEAAPAPVGPQYFYVSYEAPAGVELPLQAGGRWWMANSVHVLFKTCADELRNRPGFQVVGDAPTPTVPFDCGCGH